MFTGPLGFSPLAFEPLINLSVIIGGGSGDSNAASARKPPQLTKAQLSKLRRKFAATWPKPPVAAPAPKAAPPPLPEFDVLHADLRPGHKLILSPYSPEEEEQIIALLTK